MSLDEFFTGPFWMILVVLGFSTAIVVIVIALLAAGRRAREALLAAAGQRGWEASHDRAGRRTITAFRATDRDGHPWLMEAVTVSSRSSRSSGSSYTRWLSDAVRLEEGVLLVGPHMGSLPPRIDVDQPLVRMAISLILRMMIPDAAPEDVQAFDEVTALQAGSELLRERYAVLGQDESAAKRLLTSDVESALLDYAMQVRRDQLPQIVFWPRGLHIRVSPLFTKIEEFERLARLGETLLEAISEEEDSIWDDEPRES